MYIQHYSNVYQLNDNLTLSYVTNIPNLTIDSPNAWSGRIFSLDDNLYAHNYNGSASYCGMLHILENNTFREVMEMTGTFFHFGNNVYVWDYRNYSLSKLSSDLQLTTIVQKTQNNIFENNYASWTNGILILQLNSYYIKLNMLTGSLYKKYYVNHEPVCELTENDQTVQVEYIQQSNIPELGQCGYQLKDEGIDQTFGQGSAEQLRQVQMKLQFKSPFQYTDQCFEAYYSNIIEKYNRTSTIIKNQIRIQRNRFQRVIQLHYKITDTFLNIFAIYE
ncbi:Hypothetical_protein [Hexamita inflata]|uniref:Hypothetical_protein n=1 Tax=Hexamita inflata TaxID=28002 RepID=A0AA86UU52_9EUKA|nr:Hypothetical protein HINF_LOCUS52592 [Hexamita inflata]